LSTGVSMKLLNQYKKAPKIYPVKGQIWITEELPKNTLNKVIFNSSSKKYWAKHQVKDTPWNCSHDTSGKQYVDHSYGRQMIDGRILFGGDRIPTTCNDYSENNASIIRNQKYVSTFLPLIKSTPIEGYWTGIMPFTKNGIPVISKLSKHVWFVGGFGPSGIMQGPGYSKMFIQELLS
jgi:glycine/D-amino acid oxidase-like deaminating enzyme